MCSGEGVLHGGTFENQPSRLTRVNEDEKRQDRGSKQPRPAKESSVSLYGILTIDFSVVSDTFVSVPAPPSRESLPFTRSFELSVSAPSSP